MAYARPSEFAENLISDMYIAALGVTNFGCHRATLCPRIAPYHTTAGNAAPQRVIRIVPTGNRALRHVRFAPIASEPSHRSDSTRWPSRPGEFHPVSLTDPDLIL